MPITTNITNYYDDFSVPNADNGLTPNDKNYLRILFKPGYSVQVRELNQMQSMLQSQIDKFGLSIWKDGTAVDGGGVSYDNNISTVLVKREGDGVDALPLSNEDVASIKTITNDENGLSADVIGYKASLFADNTYTLYIRYKNSFIDNNDENISKFENGDVCSVITEDDSPGLVGIEILDSGFAAGVFLNKGIFFTKGCFVATPAQQVFIDKIDENELVSGAAKLKVVENIITSNDDSTLLDNANGSLNSKAPGADRYSIDLQLVFIGPENDQLSNEFIYINLITTQNDKVVEVVIDRYTSIDRERAKRTFEESGNYALKPFTLELKELFKDTTEPQYALGRYTQSELSGLEITPQTPAEAKENYYIGVDSSVAYVSGFRVEPSSKSELIVKKARTLSEFVDSNIYAKIGNYCIGTFESGSQLPNISTNSEYNIYSDIGATTQIGTVKIRAIESVGGSEYRIYLYDMVLLTDGNISTIKCIRSQEVPSPLIKIIVNIPITDTNLNSKIFKLPYNAVNSVQEVEYNSLLFRDGTVTTPDLGTTKEIIFPIDSNHSLLESDSSSFILFVNGARAETFTVEGFTGQITLRNSSWVVGNTFSCIIQTKVQNSGHISKTLTSQTDTITGDLSESKVFTLSKAQILSSSLTVSYNSDPITDVTADFIIVDDGQRDNYCTNVKVKYLGSKILDDTDSFIFSYHYFNNSSVGYATVDSYVDPDANNIYGLTRSDIPSYKGVRLTDVIDFRPVILDGTSPTLQILNPNSLIELGIKFYLPKVDKVVIGSNNKISVVSGIPSLNPIEPETPLDTMDLYVLEVPAYTHNVSDIGINIINNRRYTMRDIGAIDQRVSNLEYYTTLSLLEKSANEKPISDIVETRFKNGIIVDPFIDFTTADVFNPAFKASIDIIEGTLRPQYNTSRIDFKAVNSDNVNISTNTITLPYTEETYIEQNFASESVSVNPYDVAIFVGTVELSPSTDEWQDTNRIVTNVFDPNTTNIELAANTLELGDIWNNWVVTESYTYRKRKKWWKKKKTYTEIVEQQRTGISRTLELEDVENEAINDINLTIIPFIRSRKIYFIAKNLKPNTRYYPFFDGVNIASYVSKVTDSNYVSFKESTDVTVYTGKTPAQSGLSSISPIITNAAGEVKGVILIPNNSQLKFKTGVRQFKLTDHQTNNLNSETSYATTNYTAYGTTKTVDVTITTTRTPNIVENNIKQILRNGETVTYRDPIAQSFLIDNIRSTSGIFLSSVDLYFEKRSETLPVSICIVTMENGTPTQNIVPFSEVSLNPYVLNENGTYTTESVVNISNDSSAKTTFTFSDLVYLNAGNEYALIVRSNDSAYRVFTSRVGNRDVTTDRIIDKNPYSGVMFMSANSSTWTADQNRDIKFTLNCAKFTSSSETIKFIPNISSGVQSVSLQPLGTAGSGYTSAPTVTFEAPLEGTTAEGIAILDTITGSVSRIDITNPGSGYTSAPNVTFEGNTAEGGTPTSGWAANMFNAPIDVFNLTQNNIEPYGIGNNSNTGATKIFNTLSLDSNYSVVPYENYNIKAPYSITLDNSSLVELNTVFQTQNEYVSPLIDLDNVSLLAVSNVIGPAEALDDSEILSDGGNGLSRYITKTVNLNQPADRITVFVDVNRPTANSYIKIYAKLKHDDSTNSWYEMIPRNGTIAAPQNGIPVSSDDSEFSEVEYTKSTDKEFTSFVIKIVFVSDVTNTPTTVRNFRAIATFGIE